EMQSQFFEHSQLQTKLITEMLSHLGRAQQASVRQDLARIDEIGRELNDIKTQLAQVPEGGSAGRDVDRSVREPERPLLEVSAASVAEPGPSVGRDTRPEDRTEPVGAERSGSDRESSAKPVDERIAGAAAKGPSPSGAGHPAGSQPHRGTSDAHAWLSQ